eukprot:493923-Pelagomonas_calceolata.AAC.1
MSCYPTRVEDCQNYTLVYKYNKNINDNYILVDGDCNRQRASRAPYLVCVCNSRMLSVVVAEGALVAPVSMSCYLASLYNIITKRTLDQLPGGISKHMSGPPM